MKNKKGILILIMIITILLVTGGIFFYFKHTYITALNTPNSESAETVEFEILSGESIDTIIPSLINQELLRKEYQNYFIFYLKQNNIATEIQAGLFNIPKNLTIIELAETLKNAQKPSVWVTIPEGLRTDEIADILEKDLKNFNKELFLNMTNNKEFISSLNLNTEELHTLEGFIYPDKYLFEKDINTEQTIEIIINNFKNKVPETYSYDDIILASLIEREAVNAEDRRIISGILQKRLEEQWLLQVDATLLYHHKDWKHVITVEDLEEDHIYNTYKYYGLPPQPICNPGLDSIISIYEAKQTDFYFYIHDNDRNPHYAKTLAEHEQNVQKYLR